MSINRRDQLWRVRMVQAHARDLWVDNTMLVVRQDKARCGAKRASHLSEKLISRSAGNVVGGHPVNAHYLLLYDLHAAADHARFG